MTVAVDFGPAKDVLELDGLEIRLKTGSAEDTSLPVSELVASINVYLEALIDDTKVSSKYTFTIELKTALPEENLVEIETASESEQESG